MGTVNVNSPDGLEEEINRYIEEAGLFVNRSELVRDAVRHRLEKCAPLSAEMREGLRESERQIERGEYLSSDEVREKYLK